jgi:hypothetical protein
MPKRKAVTSSIQELKKVPKLRSKTRLFTSLRDPDLPNKMMNQVMKSLWKEPRLRHELCLGNQEYQVEVKLEAHSMAYAPMVEGCVAWRKGDIGVMKNAPNFHQMSRNNFAFTLDPGSYTGKVMFCIGQDTDGIRQWTKPQDICILLLDLASEVAQVASDSTIVCTV